jgi:hypothetical protein
MVVGCQPYAPAAFTPRNIPGTHFHYGLSRPQGHGLVGRKYVTEKSSDNTTDGRNGQFSEAFSMDMEASQQVMSDNVSHLNPVPLPL